PLVCVVHACYRQAMLPSVRSVLRLPPPPEIYILSLHDALPIFHKVGIIQKEVQRVTQELFVSVALFRKQILTQWKRLAFQDLVRSEEHTSELQSRENLVCRLLLEKKKI